MRVKGKMVMDRLQRLVFSYYREDPFLQKALYPLNFSRMSLNKGSVCIECLDLDHLDRTRKLLFLLKEPIDLLGLARRIVLYMNGSIQLAYPIQQPFHIDLLT